MTWRPLMGQEETSGVKTSTAVAPRSSRSVQLRNSQQCIHGPIMLPVVARTGSVPCNIADSLQIRALDQIEGYRR
jgi:hypothetical protein